MPLYEIAATSELRRFRRLAGGSGLYEKEIEDLFRANSDEFVGESLRDTHGVMAEESTTPDLVEPVRGQAEAANRRDVDCATSSFAPDAVFDGRAVGDIYEGLPAIRSFLEDWFGDLIARLTISDIDEARAVAERLAAERG